MARLFWRGLAESAAPHSAFGIFTGILAAIGALAAPCHSSLFDRFRRGAGGRQPLSGKQHKQRGAGGVRRARSMLPRQRLFSFLWLLPCAAPAPFALHTCHCGLPCRHAQRAPVAAPSGALV